MRRRYYIFNCNYFELQTFNAANPYVQGIAGILDAYQNAIRRVQLYGPTNFSPVINHVSRYEMENEIPT